MNLRNHKTAPIALMLLSFLSFAAARAATPHSYSSDRVCRGTLARNLDYSVLPVKTLHTPTAKSCPLSVFGPRTAVPRQCWIGDFTDLEGGGYVMAGEQQEAGSVPSKYFHFLGAADPPS